VVQALVEEQRILYGKRMAARSAHKNMAILKKVIKSQYFNPLMGVFVSFILVLFGIAALLKGDPGYRNYWGGLVFAPFAIAIGPFYLGVIVLQWPRP
jgi:hypothetical protein